MIQGFYEELSDHHTFLEDYAAELDALFKDAQEAGTLPSMSDVTVQVPPVHESCEAVLDPVRQTMVLRVAELNEGIDCINFLTTELCSGLEEQVETTLSENANLLTEIADRTD